MVLRRSVSIIAAWYTSRPATAHRLVIAWACLAVAEQPQDLPEMNEKQLGLLIISPMIIGTAILLYRQQAMGVKSVAAVTVAVVGISAYLFLNF
jgi:hypothetical protein